MELKKKIGKVFQFSNTQSLNEIERSVYNGEDTLLLGLLEKMQKKSFFYRKDGRIWISGDLVPVILENYSDEISFLKNHLLPFFPGSMPGKTGNSLENIFTLGKFKFGVSDYSLFRKNLYLLELQEAVYERKLIDSSLAERLSGIIFGINEAGEIIESINTYHLEYTDSMLTGRNLRELVNMEKMENFDEVLNSGNNERIDLPLYNRNGGTNWFEAVTERIIVDGLPYIILACKSIDKLREYKEKLDVLLKYFPQVFYIVDPSTYEVLLVNDHFRDVLPRDPIGRKCYEEFQGFSEPCPFCTNDIIAGLKDKPYSWEYFNPILKRHYTIDDQFIGWPDGRKVRFELATDITDLKKMQKEREILLTNLEKRVKEVNCLYSINELLKDEGFTIEEALQEICRLIPNGWYSPAKTWAKIEIDGKNYFSDNYQNAEIRIAEKLHADKQYQGVIEVGLTEDIKTFTGDNFLKEEKQLLKIIAGNIEAIIRKKLSERALRESNARLENITKNLPNGIVNIFDRELRYIYNEGMEMKRQGLTNETLVGKTVTEVLGPELGGYVAGYYNKVLKGKEVSFEGAFGDTYYKIYAVPLYDESGKVKHILALSINVTESKLAEEKMTKLMGDLKRSNEELEQFAYVASHDLQEPLRMVSSYTQLLARRYSDKLDQDAREFIDFAVDGATRMQKLINDLLQYSRVTTRGEQFQKVDMNELLAHVIKTLKYSIDETRAEVVYHNLPMISADETQMAQIFQNLISNSIKFKSEASPKIKIDCVNENGDYHFTVSDNGIGIEENYFDKVFLIFQRLHTRREYPGTGIGLALCKRIIQRHNGKIWIESKPGNGTTFHLTFPKNKGED